MVNNYVGSVLSRLCLPVQERLLYPAGQDQGERAHTTSPFLLRGLDSAGSGVRNLHRESGTRCRPRQTLACTQATANCTRPAKGRIGDRMARLRWQRPQLHLPLILLLPGNIAHPISTPLII